MSAHPRASTHAALPPVLRLPLRNRLPLHVDRRIQTAASKRVNAINYVPLARPLTSASSRAGMLRFKFHLDALAALDSDLCARGGSEDSYQNNSCIFGSMTVRCARFRVTVAAV